MTPFSRSEKYQALRAELRGKMNQAAFAIDVQEAVCQNVLNELQVRVNQMYVRVRKLDTTAAADLHDLNLRQVPVNQRDVFRRVSGGSFLQGVARHSVGVLQVRADRYVILAQFQLMEGAFTFGRQRNFDAVIVNRQRAAAR